MAISERPEQVLNDDDVEHLFAYHQPTAEDVVRHEAINAGTKAFALVIRENVPPGPERTLAVRALQRLRMDCNLAIATERREPAEVVVESSALERPVEYL